MAFDVVYIFKAINQFSKVTKEINKSLDDVRKKARMASKSQNKEQKKAKKNISSRSKAQKKASRAATIAVKKASQEQEKSAQKAREAQKKTKKAIQDVIRARIKAAKGIKKLTKLQRINSKVFKGFSAILTNMRFRIASFIISTIMSGAGIQNLIQSGKKYEEALYELEALTGVAGGKLQFLEDQALSLGKQFGVTADEILTGMRLVASKRAELVRNEDIEGIVELTKWATILTTKQLSMAEASKALAGSLNIMNVSTKEAGRFANVLAAASKYGASEIHQTIRAVIKSGAAAKLAGLDFEQLVAMILVLAKAEISANTAGVSLNTVLIRMGKAGKSFKDVGIEEVFSNVLKETKSLLSEQEQITFQAKLFGLRQIKAGHALQTNAGLLKTFQEAITGTNVAVEQAAIRLKKYEKISASIFEFWNKIKRDIFEKMKPNLLELQRQFVILLSILNHILDSKTLIDSIVSLTAKLTKLVNSLLFIGAALSTPFKALAMGTEKGTAKMITHGLELLKLWKDIKAIESTQIKTTADLEKMLGVTTETSPVTGIQAATASPKNGNIDINVNLKGNAEQVSSVETTNDTEFNVGTNFSSLMLGF